MKDSLHWQFPFPGIGFGRGFVKANAHHLFNIFHHLSPSSTMVVPTIYISKPEDTAVSQFSRSKPHPEYETIADGRFKIGKQIAKGCCGIVFKGEDASPSPDRGNRQDVAIKFVRSLSFKS